MHLISNTTDSGHLKVAAKRALQLMDLTTLNEDDTDEKVIALCHQAKSPTSCASSSAWITRFGPNP